MFRLSFALVPVVLAALAVSAFAEEPAPGKEKVVPLWHQVTNDSSESKREVKQEATGQGKADAKEEIRTDAQAETKAETREEPKEEPKTETKEEPKTETKEDAKSEAKEEVKAENGQDDNAEAKTESKAESKTESPADAAGKKAPEGNVKEAGKEVEFGTQEQYRACMDSESRIKDLRKMLEEHIALNNEMMMEIKNQANALLEMQRKLVMSDDAQVQAFNQRTEAHNKLVKAANEASDKVRAELDAFNMTTMEHNQSCASLIVKMSDRDAVIKERTPAVNQ